MQILEVLSGEQGTIRRCLLCSRILIKSSVAMHFTRVRVSMVIENAAKLLTLYRSHGRISLAQAPAPALQITEE